MLHIMTLNIMNHQGNKCKLKLQRGTAAHLSERDNKKQWRHRVLARLGRNPLAGWLTHSRTHCRWGGTVVQPLWGAVWQFFKELNMQLPHDPVIVLPRRCSSHRSLHTNAHKRFTCDDPNWKQPSEWVSCGPSTPRNSTLQYKGANGTHTHAHTHTLSDSPENCAEGKEPNGYTLLPPFIEHS